MKLNFSKATFTDVYNYRKFFEPSDLEVKYPRVTGKLLSIDSVEKLLVIDIDNHADDKNIVYDKFFNILPDNCIAEKTGNMGIHIYVYNDLDAKFTKNRFTKIIENVDWDIDIFLTAVDSENKILVSGSKIESTSDKKIKTYRFIKNSFEYDKDVISFSEFSDILYDNFEINLKEKLLEKQEVKPSTNKKIENKIDFSKLIVGFKDIEIHNYSSDKLENRLSLFEIFLALNDIPDNQSLYDYIYNYSSLTQKAKNNFYYQKEMYSTQKSSYKILFEMLKYHNPTFFNDFQREEKIEFEEYLDTLLELIESKKTRINLSDSFTLKDIRQKKYNLEYEVVIDMEKVLCQIVEKNVYVLKVYNTIQDYSDLRYLTKQEFCSTIEEILVPFKDETCKQLTMLDMFVKYQECFKYGNDAFISGDKDTMSYFSGYSCSEMQGTDKIQLFLTHIKEIICSNNIELNNYVVSWISYILQNPGKKTEVALILRSDEGTGKNVFTDTICKLIKQYSQPNISDIDEVVGEFNSSLENCMLMILNEMRNTNENRNTNYDCMKSIITDKVVRINEKNEKRRTVQNVVNIIICSNEVEPMKIENSDRRYCVIDVSNEKIGDQNYFPELIKETEELEFSQELLNYFMTYDIKDFNPRIIPMTEAKEEIEELSKSSVELFVEENQERLTDGMEQSACYEAYKTFCTENTYTISEAKYFRVDIRKYCRETHDHTYILKK